ncbi:MAG: hypothetical protein RIC35_01700 [Marinoscillum sp.]
MNHILIGNGLIIQYGGSDYLNDRIIERAFELLNSEDFPGFAFPVEIGDWIKLLHLTIPEIIHGEFDHYAVIGNEKNDLLSFKNRYKNTTAINQVGFEDFFFIHQLYCRKNKVDNPDRFYIQEHIKRFFIHSIYNSGKINQVMKSFPSGLKTYLLNFDSIFTTNYDSNLERFIGTKIFYLHGAFHFLDDPYDPKSLRNYLSDRPLDSAPDLTGYEYLFSNCISYSSGELKDSKGTQGKLANEALEKFRVAFQNDPKLKAEISKWGKADNSLVNKLYESIVKSSEDNNLKYSDNHSISNLSDIKGNLTILGLSPFNDSHIFKRIQENGELKKITYFFYDKSDCEILKSKIKGKEIAYKDVTQLWKSF